MPVRGRTGSQNPNHRACTLPHSRYPAVPKTLPKGRVVEAVPLGVIEILSPDDSMWDILERFRDHASLGVGEIFLMDPERYVCYRLEDQSLIVTHAPGMNLRGNGTITLDTDAIVAKLRTERERN